MLRYRIRNFASSAGREVNSLISHAEGIVKSADSLIESCPHQNEIPELELQVYNEDHKRCVYKSRLVFFILIMFHLQLRTNCLGGSQIKVQDVCYSGRWVIV
jgi:hypothetical protein